MALRATATPVIQDVAPLRASRLLNAIGWSAVGALFVAIHSPTDRILSLGVVQRLLPRLPGWVGTPELLVRFVVAPLRAALFVPSVALLAWLLHRELRPRLALTRADWRDSLLVFGALSALVIPFRVPYGVKSMGVDYGKMSVDPFNTHSGWFYRRVLVPAVAHYTGLSGPLFFLVSTVLTFLLVVVVHHATRRALGSRDRFAVLVTCRSAPRPSSRSISSRPGTPMPRTWRSRSCSGCSISGPSA